MIGSEPGRALEPSNPLSSSRPFEIVHEGPRSQFVHVLDDSTTEILVRELDTAADFVSYLAAKEELLTSRRVRAAGEEELLAIYKRTMVGEHRHGFNFPDVGTLYIDEGFWNAFNRSPKRRAQLKADEVSYFWDDLIEHFSLHLRNRSLGSSSGSRLEDAEIPLRFLARESRVRRRILTKSLREVMHRAVEEGRSARIEPPAEPGDPFYVFVVLARADGADRSIELENRRAQLAAYCDVTRYLNPLAEDIVGIATDAANSTSFSGDLLYLDGRRWTETDAERGRALQEAGFLSRVHWTPRHESEYPVPGHPEFKGRSRNELCGCGSGLKTKRCCGSHQRKNDLGG